MNVNRPLQSTLSLSASLLILGGSFILPTGAGLAQSRQVQLNLPNLNAPGNRQSGSSRSESCIAVEDELVALMPESNYGLTIEEYPSFFFYLPETSAPVVEFAIYNEATMELVYEGRFTPQGEMGIVSITLPNNGLQKALEVGQSYFWGFSVVCDVENPSSSIVVQGTLRRIEPSTSLSAALEVATPETLPSILAEAGIWHDALQTSAQLAANTNGEAWKALLEAVDLGDLTTAPVLSRGLIVEPTPVSNAIRVN